MARFGELTSEPQDGSRTVRKLVDDNRGDPSDPHSPICYASLGCELEHNCSAGELARFAGDMWQSTDPAMRSLATYARFLSHAKRYRLAGDISAAVINEAAADTVYERDILPENRW